MARILRVPDPLLPVQRFDRVRGDGVVLRLHIVDACQALDFPGVNRADLAREMGRMARAAPVAASEVVKSAEYVGDERTMVVGVAHTVARHARQLADAIPPLRTVAAGTLSQRHPQH